ncbi:MAG: outer membrane protein assembly factor BamA [Treponema sp.]|nr:outer membrane protein assembly factor BamA [Treponema sp.]MCL2236738.1 outer membrane protein assembly factor BamA [Treponema sp.]
MRFGVFVLLLILPAVYCFSQDSVSDDWYLGRPIREISFSGLANVSNQELLGIMNPYVGRSFDYNVFWEIQGRLYALEYFDRIEPSLERHASSNDVIIKFAVVERPVIGRINFIGNSGLRPAELRDVITSRVNDIHNQAKVRADIEAIIKKYVEKGYPNAVVTTSESQSGTSTITLNFHITENERISITRINFHGNSRFSANTLRSQLSLKQRSLVNPGAFQESSLLADRETIARYYHDRGYIDAVVRDVTRSFESDDKGSNLTLTFMIEEGAEYRFAGITFEGNVIFGNDHLEKLVTHRVGDIVNLTRVEMDLQRIADLYYENGYIFNSINRTPNRNTVTHTLSYHVTIVERSRAYIENIIIVGNNKTQTEVILREIPLEPGDVFSRTKILEAMTNLYNLQYFSAIIPETPPGSAENLMDLIFTVEEQPTIDVQFGITFSGSADPESFPISGLVKLNDRNVGGSGNELGIELNSSVVDTSSLALNYVHRWAFGLPLSLGIDFSANYSRKLATMDNQYPFFNGDESWAYPDGFISREEYDRYNRIPTRDYLMQYDQWYISLGLSTGYRWNNTPLGRFSINGGIRFGMIKNNYDEEYRPFDPILRAGNDEWTPRNSFSIGLSLDRRDIFYDPSRGFYIFQRFAIFGLFPDEREHYLRSESKIQFFRTLFNIPVTDTWNLKGVLAFHTGLSLLMHQPHRFDSSNPNVPPVIDDGNKLAVDGMFVGRGWNTAFRNKGLLLVDSWLELRIPLVQGILAWDFFFDVAAVETEQGYYFGTNSRGEPNFTEENLRFSYGGGLRFTMPQFPIRISILKRFLIRDNQVEWMPGVLGGDRNNPFLGVDLVMSFYLSY